MGNVRYWHKADISFCTANVRFRGQSGHRPVRCTFLLFTYSGHFFAVLGRVLINRHSWPSLTDVRLSRIAEQKQTWREVRFGPSSDVSKCSATGNVRAQVDRKRIKPKQTVRQDFDNV